VPLDRWIEAVGLNAEVVFWGVTVLIFIGAFWAEGKYSAIERLFYAARPVRISEDAYMRFLERLEAAQALLTEVAREPREPLWHQRVVQWNLSVERLIHDELPPSELVGYRTVNLAPALDQPLEVAVESLEGRRNKLRAMVMRLMPRSWARRRR
jgi:hypothetical protein